MRILALNWTDWRSRTAGGSEVHLYEMFRRWVAAGHQVTLACGYHAGLRDLRDRTHRELDSGIEILRSGPWYFTDIAVRRLARRLLRSRRFDVVLDTVNKLPFFAPRWASPVPVVAIVHHLFGRTIERDFGRLRGAYYLALERKIPRVYGATRLIAISDSTKEALIELGADDSRIDVVHCGLDRAYLEPPKLDRFVRPTLLVVSRLRAYKRVDVAIGAIAALRERLQDVQFLIAGTGTDEARLRELVRRMALAPRVTFLGHVDDAEKRRLLAQAHVLCNASEVEGWGLVCLEANALGTPVLAADSQGLRDSVREGETGFLFPRGDSRALADLAHRLLTDQATWRRLSAGGRAWARRFDWDETARRTLEILEAAAWRDRRLRPAAVSRERASISVAAAAESGLPVA